MGGKRACILEKQLPCRDAGLWPTNDYRFIVAFFCRACEQIVFHKKDLPAIIRGKSFLLGNIGYIFLPLFLKTYSTSP
jgi:hypothetical protein